MFTVTLFDGSQRTINSWQYSDLATAKRVARNTITVEEESSEVRDGDGELIREYRREGEEVVGFDADGNQVETSKHKEIEL